MFRSICKRKGFFVKNIFTKYFGKRLLCLNTLNLLLQYILVNKNFFVWQKSTFKCKSNTFILNIKQERLLKSFAAYNICITILMPKSTSYGTYLTKEISCIYLLNTL